jgi:hypothetical protein
VPACALIFGLNPGCKGSLNAEANASASADGEASADGNASLDAELKAAGKGEMTRNEASQTAANAGIAGVSGVAASSRVLLGARHDLKLSPGKGTASCQCLSVALGGSRSSGMTWSSTPPDLDDATQLTIALSSEGTVCKDEPKGSLGASYWGYKISGNDVIVLVESARGGHPLTSGAVIPRPVGSGQVYVQPAAKKLPYGRALDGKGACKIGNPGQARPSGFTELELGEDAPSAATPSQDAPAPADTPMTIDMNN